LEPARLHFYAFCAMTTMGDVDDFRHFLPRILELLNDDEFLLEIDQEVVLSKLSYGKWDMWPVKEQRAVREYLLAHWAIQLHKPPSADRYQKAEVGRWLCALARAETDLFPYLELWRRDKTEAARDNLARFRGDYQGDLFSARSPDGYWKDSESQWKQVVAWFLETET
jgi:hypothetical protein